MQALRAAGHTQAADLVEAIIPGPPADAAETTAAAPAAPAPAAPAEEQVNVLTGEMLDKMSVEEIAAADQTQVNALLERGE